ncbi:MAG: hypothetical protein ACFFBD_08465 [Candidatus Hodarchaeota archaeon]
MKESKDDIETLVYQKQAKTNELTQEKYLVTALSDLSKSDTSTALLAQIVDISPMKFYFKKNIGQKYYQKFIVADNTDVISCVHWNPETISLTKQQIVIIKDFVLKGEETQREIHCDNLTQISDIDLDLNQHLLINSSAVYKKYKKWLYKNAVSIKKGIETNDKKCKIIGMVTQVTRISHYPACHRCLGKIQLPNQCKRCNIEVQPINYLFVSFILDDGTDAIRVTVFGSTCKKLLALTNKENELIRNLPILELSDSALVANKIQQLIGKICVCIGIVKQNKFTKLSEMTASEMYIMS